MRNPFSHQSQFELFPGGPGARPKKARISIFGRSLTFSFENMVVLVIAFIMGMVVSFSFGVEKGKRSERKKVQQKTEGRIVKVPQPIDIKEETALAKSQTTTARQIGEEAGPSKITESQEKIQDFEKKVDKSPTLEKIHTIQVASFKQQSRADTEAENLQKLRYDAFTAQKGSYWIVCVGHFSESSEAQTLLKALKKQYSDCYIRSL